MISVMMLEIDTKLDFLCAMRDIILINGGSIYGGFIRDMILIKADVRNPDNSRIYPADIDVVIGFSDYKKMIDHIKNDRGYTLLIKNKIDLDYCESRNLHIKEKTEVTVTNDRDTILLDITILVPAEDTDKNNLCIMNSFFEDMPREFETNRFINRPHYLMLNLPIGMLYKGLRMPEEDLEFSKIESDTKNKIAVLMTDINNVSENRVKKMLNNGFKIVSADRTVQWTEKPLDKDIICLICHEELKSRWVAMQNIINPACKCKMTYLCASVDSMLPGNHNNCIRNTKDNCIICLRMNEA
jgi:hypothetical protein